MFKKFFIGLAISALFIACQKETTTTGGTVYVPSSSDTTANASLAELQEGRALYVANCGKCHGLYSPDAFSVSRWKTIISQWSPRTSMSSSEITLVTKYVCRGKQ